jgi:hypothetical protein
MQSFANILRQNVVASQDICNQFVAMMQLKRKAFATSMEDSMDRSDELSESIDGTGDAGDRYI